MNCERPDRDVPRMKCGYPIPCPWHTVVVDTTIEPTTITEPVTAGLSPLARERIRQLAVHLGTVMFATGFVSPCDCDPSWDRFRVGNLDVRECRRCGATWTERHRRAAKNVVMF